MKSNDSQICITKKKEEIRLPVLNNNSNVNKKKKNNNNNNNNEGDRYQFLLELIRDE